jgi:hypothetical protein
MFIMRKIFTLLLLLAGCMVHAQQYNNEWIQYSQTYYKIKVAQAGVYRIPKSLLDANGLGSTDVRYFELWRNGQKVPFYPSVSSGTLPSNGYIEFWGEKNDGKPDKALYRDPSYQHTDKISLQTDTAAYFLSVNTSQAGFKISDVNNNVAGNSLPAEPYFMYTAGNYYQGAIPNLGFAAVVGSNVYSSSYDVGEFFSSGTINPGTPLTTTLSNLYTYTGGPADSYLRFGAVGTALFERNLRVIVNGTTVKDTVMNYFNDVLSSATISTSLIGSGVMSVQYVNASATAGDKMVASFFEVTYPRQFNFGGQANFRFELPAKSSGYFLQISNFSYGSAQPVLYDLANGERYVGDISSGAVRFALPGSANTRQLVLVSEDASNVTNVTQLTTRNFVNYSNAANQGDFIIITHPQLYTGSAGNNPVLDYKAYRESSAGGSHRVLVAEIDDLVDQFAFGIKKHPLSVRNFIRFARAQFKPGFVFLIGRGMNYSDYQRGDRNPTAYTLTDQLNLVPTFGFPASDNLLSAEDLTQPYASTPIGRLSVVRGSEIENYLDKIKEYELAQANNPNTLAGRNWMKNVVHVTGSSDAYLGVVLCNYMDNYKQMIEDTLFGGNVTTFCKTSTNPVEIISADRLTDKFAEGISFLTYFGHSSATTLEFNIDNPEAYNNQGKYPVFFVNGCDAGDFFNYYPQRFVANETLSEKFVLAKERGGIAFVASTHYGIVSYLNLYLLNLYQIIGGPDYSKSLGETVRDAMKGLMMEAGNYDFYARMHAEEMTIDGDPSIKINASSKPDYVIEESNILLNLTFISVAETKFTLKVKAVNLGRAVDDSIRVEIKQTYPDGTSAYLFNQKIKGVHYADSVTLSVPINTDRDKGLNKITVVLDADNAVNEITETNNTITKEFYIYEEEARPVYPYNYAIINNPTQKLYASTANPLSSLRTYVMEIDTTAKYNSAMKISKTLSSIGGIIEFDPATIYKDSITYYWRVAQVPTDNSAYHWLESSFMYVNGNVEGFGQQHYYQHLNSATDHISLTDSLKWVFGTTNHTFFGGNGVYPDATSSGGAYVFNLDGTLELGPGCAYNELNIDVLDPVTFKPWINQYSGSSGLYGTHGCGLGNRIYNFMFYHSTAAQRKQVMDFLDLVPNGYYVIVRNNASDEDVAHGYPLNVYVDKWKADTTLYGTDQSLYHRLFYAGFYELDSFYVPRAFNFIYKKGDPRFAPKYTYSKGPADFVTLSATGFTLDTVGTITSPQFGPAKKWYEVRWDGTSIESPSTDNPSVNVVGIDKNGAETVLYQLDRNTHVQDISSVDPAKYPYITLRMRNIDSLNLTPFQLKYWRLHYEPAPEGAIAPNLYLQAKDTLDLGDSLKFAVAFKDVSKQSFDSIAVRATVIDRNNASHVVFLGKVKPISTGDTVVLRFNVGTVPYSADNTLFVDFNIDNDQPEYAHFNNFLYHKFYVRPDRTSPTLDVTFDGVHILNRDIVSAKPHIQIRLNDESQYLLLSDTAVGTVSVVFPDKTTRSYHYDGDTLRFVPASSGSNNTATIEFSPQFTKQINPEGDEYELIVVGKDATGNKVSDLNYHVTFRVISKPMISNLLNYPNPFSTSTAFVFTITGTDVPQNIRIQVLTITGKIVREITMNELGPLHIGRNITQFKWDGRDQYGDKLANGVYLYRVVTSLNGKPMDKFTDTGDDTDKYFNNGYGKMYLMR